MTTQPTKTITVQLPFEEAWALAELCKRIGFGGCLDHAIDKNEAYTMLDAIAKLQKALANEGINPR